MLKWLLAIVVVIGALAAGGWYYVYPMFKAPPPKWKTEAVKRGDISVIVTATGTVSPTQTVQVGAQASGIVNQVLKLTNDPVKKGEILAKLDTDLLDSDKRAAEVRLRQTRAALDILKVEHDNLKIRATRLKSTREHKVIAVARAKCTLELAVKNLKRYQDLLKVDAISQTDLDTRTLDESNGQHDLKLMELDLEDLDIDQKQIEADTIQLAAKEDQATADILNAQAALDRAVTNLGYATIYSPIDGVVLQQQIEIGQTIVASFQTPNLFKLAADLSKVHIDAQIDEADIGRITAGQEVTFEVDAYRDDTFTGTVTMVQLQSESKGNLVTYPVRVVAKNPPTKDHPFGKLLPGMTTALRFVVEQHKNVMLLPSAALRFSPPAGSTPGKNKDEDDVSETKVATTKHGSRGVVYVVNAKGLLEGRDVRVGENDGDYFELLESTFKEGDQVVVALKV